MTSISEYFRWAEHLDFRAAAELAGDLVDFGGATPARDALGGSRRPTAALGDARRLPPRARSRFEA